MKKITIQTTLLASLMAVLASTAVQAQEVGKVISSTPIIQQVAVPRQVCNNEQVVTGGQKSGAGAAMGAIAGGAIGNNVGQGSGRAAATMLGLFGGAILGDKIEGPGTPEVRNVQNCSQQCFTRTAPWPTTWFMNTRASNTPCKCHKTQAPPCACKSPPWPLRPTRAMACRLQALHLATKHNSLFRRLTNQKPLSAAFVVLGHLKSMVLQFIPSAHHDHRKNRQRQHHHPSQCVF